MANVRYAEAHPTLGEVVACDADPEEEEEEVVLFQQSASVHTILLVVIICFTNKPPTLQLYQFV